MYFCKHVNKSSSAIGFCTPKTFVHKIKEFKSHDNENNAVVSATNDAHATPLSESWLDDFIDGASMRTTVAEKKT